MLTVYHANQLNILKSEMAKIIHQTPLDSVFDKEVILVQSHGMGQWLQIQLAQELKIAANIEFPFTNEFVWQIYQLFVEDLPSVNGFNPDFMTWALLEILPDFIRSEPSPLLKHYFGESSQNDASYELKLYQFASSIARQFDQYLVYRPDWISAWQKGELIKDLHPSQVWQAKLWQMLLSYCEAQGEYSINRMEIHQSVISRLRSGAVPKALQKRLPKRIFIFGVVSLPPLYLDLFHALSAYIDVNFMFMNPCQYYWADLVDTRYLSNKKYSAEQIEALKAQNHPLLISWGKLGRDYLSTLLNYDDVNDVDLFECDNKPALLNQIQRSILELDSPNGDLSPSVQNKIEIDVNDVSITFHSCHSEQREVEVLYDYLLKTLDEDDRISLNDCVVMVADIDRYVPYIKAVFDNAPKHRKLPYTISDQTLRYIDPVIQGFLLLLDLPTKRMEIEYVFDLLEIPSIAQHFKLSESQIKQLQYWVVDSGIRWGVDSNLDEPRGWLIGLKRMLLGYVMESHGQSWQEILPYNGPRGLDADIIGLLGHFIDTLSSWHQILSESKTVDEWQSCCFDLLNAFFDEDSQTEQLLLMINTQWQSIIKQASLAHYSSKIEITILREIIQAKLGSNQLSNRFLMGKLNFCTMMPMRSVPFKVVCLLGMNDGVYPRVTLSNSFDLINHHKRLGDRSRQHDDRYLFLEALLSAQLKLYISYIGHNIQTNDERYPSILVDELLEYIDGNYKTQNQDDKPNKSLSESLVIEHPRTPFNALNYHQSNWQSYADEWLPAAKKAGQVQSFLQPLAPVKIDLILIEDLKRFYAHSIRELARQRLGFAIFSDEENLPDAEKFDLDALERYQVNQSLLTALIGESQQDESTLFEQMLRGNQLPYGAFSSLVFEEQKNMMSELADKIMQEKQEIHSTNINLFLDNTHLVGKVNGLQEDGIFQWLTSKLTARHGISLWIDHLCYCAANSHLSPDFMSRIYGRNNTEWRFGLIDATCATQLLAQLIFYYQLGMNSPLFMPLNTTVDVLDKNRQIDNQDVLEKAKNDFIKKWNDEHNSLDNDDYYQRFYPEITEDLIIKAIEIGKICLLPMISANRPKSKKSK